MTDSFESVNSQERVATEILLKVDNKLLHSLLFALPDEPLNSLRESTNGITKFIEAWDTENRGGSFVKEVASQKTTTVNAKVFLYNDRVGGVC